MWFDEPPTEPALDPPINYIADASASTRLNRGKTTMIPVKIQMGEGNGGRPPTPSIPRFVLFLMAIMTMLAPCGAADNSGLSPFTAAPFTADQVAPVILADAAQPVAPKADYILKACQETEHTPDFPMSALRGVDPAGLLWGYMQDKYNKAFDIAAIKPVLLQGTTHGKIAAGVSTESKRVSYRYDPNLGYLGNDQATFMVEFKGKYYKLIVDIKVLQVVDDDAPVCPPPKLIKVGKPRRVTALGTDHH